ncbi:MAG: hypothetical protein VYE32_01050 [Candidatus Thermoplasmatota archaeon]|nr:hypothetical protein [Candidatus Thermoplasmatota archaeon]
MSNDNEKNVGILFLSILNSKYNIEQCIKRSELTAEEISNLISIPKFQKYFRKETENELLLSCETDWISEELSKNIRINKSEKKILHETIKEKIIPHISEYWKENGKVKRDFEIRTLPEWIVSEFVFLSGFAIWFREKENDNETDLSVLLSKATGEDVQASANIEFDQNRLQIVNSIPTQILQKIMNINPAGKIAYRSLDMAVMKGMADGNSDIAKKMKKISRHNKPWWKFW